MSDRRDVTFYIDVNAMDEQGRVGTTLIAATSTCLTPQVGDLVRAQDSDGYICCARVEQVEPNGWLRA